MLDGIIISEVLATIFYTALALVLFVVCFKVIDWLTPFSLHEELAKHQNTAVAIILGSTAIAMSILIAAVIRS